MRAFVSICSLVVLFGAAAFGQPTIRNMDDFLKQCGLTEQKINSPDVLLTRAWSSKAWARANKQRVESCGGCDAASASFGTSGEVVWITEFTESGDWMQQSAYCYDPRGNLTRAGSVFRQVTNWAAVQVYQASGSALKRVSEHFTDFEGKPIQRPSQADDYPDQLGTLPAYTRIEQLPFGGFITKPQANGDRQPTTDA